MSTIPIGGVPVEFPFDPYPCQKDYMQKVIQCLQQDKNGVLESPTGTGKTLCLLCSSLAWLHVKKAESQRQQLACQGSGGFNDDLGAQLQEAAGGAWSGGIGAAATPKIIYASRTHSQLSQAIQELKRTKYSYFRVGILGSRDQMCIHPKVQKEETNTAKVNSCRAKVNARTCHFYNNLDSKKNHPDFFGSGQADPKVLDIEDLVKLGDKHKVCPYYMAKELKTDADIIFMPYNYLLDPKSRKANGVELQGNVVIFDEAHNLEKICEDSSSFDFTSYDLTAAVQELQQLSDKLIDLYKEEESAVTYGDETEIAPDFNLQQILELKSQLLDFEKVLDDLEIPKNDKGLTKSGVYIFELFGKVHINFETKGQMLDLIDKIVTHLSSETSAFHGKGVGLSKLADILRIVFSRDPDDMNQSMSNHKAKLAKYYKVHIQEDKSRQKKKSTADVWLNNKSENKGRTVSYWCFSPGHSMKDLQSHGVKCIVLTSGTLAPLNSFTAEMQIEFPVQLENPHVIEPHQVMIGTVCKGPDGTILNSSYDNRDNANYQASLGNAIVNFARIVPNGLLLFFPSYPLMTKCLEYWQANRIWDRIVQYKQIFVEPRGKLEFHETMEEFYERINDPKLNGAVFAAVCRGKVSEGLDFADINGRAVVITGLPYPPYMDPKVVLKMRFLDEMQGKQQIKGLSGREWYKQQASRAVNQAIGRVIRHKQDYGAIFLCDNRFKAAASVSQLPSWVRPHVKTYESFGLAVKDSMFFFKNAEQTLPTPRIKLRKAESNTPGCQGASFMPSHSRHSNRHQVALASSVEAHIPGLKNRDDDSSLAKLKIQYECSSRPSTSNRQQTGGLIGALNFDEKKFEEDDSFDLTQGGSLKDKPTENPITSKVQRKKIILKNRPTLDGGSSSNEALNKHEKKNLPEAKQFQLQIKASLSTESYTKFSSILAKYGKTGDFTTMIGQMADIFTDEPRNHELFRRLYRYIQKEHKQQFNQVCIDLTGKGCVPDHVILAAHTGLKKRTQEQLPESSDDKRRRLDADGVKDSVLDTKSTSKTVPVTKGMTPNLDSASNLNTQALTGLKDSNSANLTTGKDVSQGKTSDFMSKCSSGKTSSGENRENPSSNNKSGEDSTENAGHDTIKLKDESVEKYQQITQEDVERVTNMDFYDPPANSGYLCVVCKNESKFPLKSPCDHYACFKCWKTTLQKSKQCPECGQAVRRRQLTKVFFPSGPLRNNPN